MDDKFYCIMPSPYIPSIEWDTIWDTIEKLYTGEHNFTKKEAYEKAVVISKISGFESFLIAIGEYEVKYDHSTGVYYDSEVTLFAALMNGYLIPLIYANDDKKIKIINEELAVPCICGFEYREHIHLLTCRYVPCRDAILFEELGKQ